MHVDATIAPGQACPTCGKVYPLDAPLWRCEMEDHDPLQLTPGPGLRPVDVQTATHSLWRYAATLRVPEEGAVSLGEGYTPTIPMLWAGRRIFAKLDFLTPTGSFKDRGASLVVSHLRRCGVDGFVEDSSGNAGASLAAYAAAGGLRSTIFAPASASPGKLAQIELYGAELRLIEGDRDLVARLARADAANYAGHNWQPFFLEGTKTLAYELWEEFGWIPPDAVVVPIGGGANLLGLHIGFGELLQCGSIERLPRLYGVQARRCAPLAEAFGRGSDVPTPVLRHETMAEGIALPNPPRGRQIMAAVRNSGGALLAVEEEEIVEALAGLLRLGISVEPSSAAGVAGLSRLVAEGVLGSAERIVMVLTGSGLKVTNRIRPALA